MIVTSLAPEMRRGEGGLSGGRDYQKRCAEAWRLAGARLISLNGADEIGRLTPDFPEVDFVAATTEGPPRISELLEVGRAEAEVFAVANSDVEFLGSASVLSGLFEAAGGGVVFGSRSERVALHAQPGPLYTAGFDLFVCDARMVSPAEIAGFTLGAPWWDYLFPFLLAARDVPLTRIASPVIAHLSHEAAWSDERWRAGLARAATELRRLAQEEGPAAAVLGHLCHSLEAGVQPGFPIAEILHPLGAALGLAMLAYIDDRCTYALWTRHSEPTETGADGEYEAVVRLPYVSATAQLAAAADLGEIAS